MVGAMFSFTIMAIAGRELYKTINTFEIMTYRSLIGIIIVVILGYYFNTLKEINIKKIKLHVLRNLLHFFGQNCWLFAIVFIPLSQMFAFEFSTPLWIILIAPIFLKERFKLSRLIAIFFGFFGVLLVSRPEITSFNIPIFAAFMCSIFFSTMTITTKILTKTESTTCILFWLTTIQAILGLICSAHSLEFNQIQGENFIYISAISVAGLLAHFCIVSALSLAPASVVTPIEFFRLPLVIIVGIILYNEKFEWEVIYGGLIILVANIYILRKEKKQN